MSDKLNLCAAAFDYADFYLFFPTTDTVRQFYQHKMAPKCDDNLNIYVKLSLSKDSKKLWI